jgi:hypothetical protein
LTPLWPSAKTWFTRLIDPAMIPRTRRLSNGLGQFWIK